MTVSVETQAATLRNLLRRATAHGLVRGGMVLRANEGELMIAHLQDMLRTLDGLANSSDIR